MGLFKKKPKEKAFTDEEWERYGEAKEAALERVLGKMHDMVYHAIIPFQVGGAVDMYCFPHALSGTAVTTMELLQPDGSGPKPNRNGTFELVICTKRRLETGEKQSEEFEKTFQRLWYILTTVARYAFMAKLEPGETAEVPGDEHHAGLCLIFDEYAKAGTDFEIQGRKHGLLLCLEIFRSEMEYAMQNGSQSLFEKMKAAGHYPYSDLDREPVV